MIWFSPSPNMYVLMREMPGPPPLRACLKEQASSQVLQAVQRVGVMISVFSMASFPST